MGKRQRPDLRHRGACANFYPPGRGGARMVGVVPTGDGSEVPIARRAQWQIAAGEAYLIGCAYVNVEGHATMHEALARAVPSPPPSSSHSSPWRRRALWLAGLL